MGSAAQLRDSGWRQGSIISLERLTIADLSPTPRVADGGKAIVVSHDCDLLSLDLEKEPYADIICARPAPEGESLGNISHGKSPRELALPVDGQQYVLSMVDRARIDREVLGDLLPDGELDADSRYVLRRWLGQRYQRTAFPDAFNERISSVQQKVFDRLKKHGSDLTAIYLIMTDAELSAAETYALSLIATVTDETAADGTKMASLQQTVDWIEVTFGGCVGVEVDTSYLRPESKVSLAELRVLKRWDVESVSLRTSPSGDIAPA